MEKDNLRGYEQFLEKMSNNIKYIRKSKNMTQEDMREHGFNYRHYQKIESGEYSPSLVTIYRLSKIWKIHVSDLLK